MRYSKLVFLMFFLWYSGTSFIFASNPPITLNTNEHFTVSLFFPSPIERVIAPADHFSFVHEKNGVLGTLRGSKGSASNLTVITSEGLIYSFTVSYSERIENFTYVLSKEQATASMAGTAEREVQDAPKESVTKIEEASKPSVSTPEPQQIGATTANHPQVAEPYAPKNTIDRKGQTLYSSNRAEYYRIFCENNYLQEARIKDNYTKIGDVQMSVKSVIRDRNEVYVTLLITNDLDAVYAMKEPQFFVMTKGNKETLEIKALYAFNYQKDVGPKSEVSMVYVFKDFSLGSDQQVYATLDALKGKRKLVLLLDKKVVGK